MRIPHGIQTDSIWKPNASRAGALHATQRYATPRHEIGHLRIPNPLPRAGQRTRLPERGEAMR